MKCLTALVFIALLHVAGIAGTKVLKGKIQLIKKKGQFSIYASVGGAPTARSAKRFLPKDRIIPIDKVFIQPGVNRVWFHATYNSAHGWVKGPLMNQDPDPKAEFVLLDPKSLDEPARILNKTGAAPCPPPTPAAPFRLPAGESYWARHGTRKPYTIRYCYLDVQGGKKKTYGILRDCQYETSENPVNDLAYADRMLRFSSPYVARAVGGDGFEVFRLKEFIGLEAAGRASFTDRKTLIPLDPSGEPGYFSVRSDYTRWVQHFEESLAGQRATGKVAVIASSHALTLINLKVWDKDWGTGAVDGAIQREIAWISLDGGQPRLQAQTERFSDLQSKGKADPALVRGLSNNSEMLDQLRVVLEKEGPFDYLVMIKDSWDIQLGDGHTRLVTFLKGLPEDVSLDILNTKMDTISGYLKMLPGESGDGRFFESKDRKSIVVGSLPNYGERVHARLRKRCLKKSGGKLSAGPPVTEKVIIKAGDPYFSFGNLMLGEHLDALTYLLRALACSVESSGQMDHLFYEIMLPMGLPFRPDDDIGLRFKEWFTGFIVADSSFFSGRSFRSLVQAAADDPKLVRALRSAAAGIEALKAEPCGISFVPDHLFSKN